MKRIFLLAVSGAVAMLAWAADKPNIIFILADDMGVGDVSHTTGLAATPNLDRLAAEGMRFTDAHTSSSVCTPSRYSLLTGRYNWRTRLEKSVFFKPEDAPLIEPGEPTVASLLHDNGYHTAMVGKWHLGIGWQFIPGFKPAPGKEKELGWNIDYSKPAITPTSNGFDYFFGIQASLDMPPYLYIENDRAIKPATVTKAFLVPNRPGAAAADFEAEKCLQDFAAKSVAYIGERAKSGKPFFLYLALTSPHTPIIPSAAWQGKSPIGPYGDFLMETDWVVGQVLSALEEHKLADNTLVFFSADNGCSTAADIPKLVAQGHAPSGSLRGNKADVYEGGHRVPFIVRWPGVVAPGSTTSRLTCLTDFTRTCADILGVDLADNAGVDSVSFLPALKGVRFVPRDPVIHHSINGSFSIREGDWKLSLCQGSGGWSDPKPGKAPKEAPAVQLFNLADDLAETRNLALEYPERVHAMTALLQRYVDAGRSTQGAPQKNARSIDLTPKP